MGKIQPEIQVYDDENMTYDFSKRQYILTAQSVLNELDIDLYAEIGSERKVKIFLKEQAGIVYRNLLQSPYNPIHSQFILFIIARKQYGRDAIFRALIEQIKYMYREFNVLDQARNIISPDAKIELANAGLWTKAPIIFDIDLAILDVGY